ncbi:hypothetical protein KKC83_02175 [Patescibacteria group bacterium]|nr:hypothetical protein [Candidatus Falkowbacteria bacterium]MBU3905614.1 hypothetical protein [Patescibacteria group bacterium]MCG2697488.1 hypothetical protein [Candidatus Parcubacteria bacterium]MBU4014603.1 hypothetical protein [Patescibacteria group bacterium]MBU4026331.1 hypothetical protein [Patescibacteria group bacterium]
MFEKFAFSENQIKNYYNSSTRDFKIALESDVPEVIFKFCYDALMKAAIAVCARNKLRVKSRQGHHIELLKKLSEILGNEDINLIGNEMRSKRNFDLYSGGTLISEKEARAYLSWLKIVFKQVDYYLTKNLKMF